MRLVRVLAETQHHIHSFITSLARLNRCINSRLYINILLSILPAFIPFLWDSVYRDELSNWYTHYACACSSHLSTKVNTWRWSVVLTILAVRCVCQAKVTTNITPHLLDASRVAWRCVPTNPGHVCVLSQTLIVGVLKHVYRGPPNGSILYWLWWLDYFKTNLLHLVYMYWAT